MYLSKQQDHIFFNNIFLPIFWYINYYVLLFYWSVYLKRINHKPLKKLSKKYFLTKKTQSTSPRNIFLSQYSFHKRFIRYQLISVNTFISLLKNTNLMSAKNVIFRKWYSSYLTNWSIKLNGLKSKLESSFKNLIYNNKRQGGVAQTQQTFFFQIKP